MSRPFLLMLASLTAAAACSSAGPNEPGADPRLCPQSYEFGNYGCFEVTGKVVGLRGQPLPGVQVNAREATSNVALSSTYPLTDQSGNFTLRAARRIDVRPSMPDTLTVYIRAADPSTATVDIRAVSDSVLALVTFAPVGSVPIQTRVNITLPEP